MAKKIQLNKVDECRQASSYQAQSIETVRTDSASRSAMALNPLGGLGTLERCVSAKKANEQIEQANDNAKLIDFVENWPEHLHKWGQHGTT